MQELLKAGKTDFPRLIPLLRRPMGIRVVNAPKPLECDVLLGQTRSPTLGVFLPIPLPRSKWNV